MADSGCEDTIPTMVPGCKLPEESDASMRARLFTSLSQSFPHSQLYKALHGGEDITLNGGDNSEDDDDSLYGDHLSNSCFASLRMDRRDSDDFDDDLRSLEWLQNEDLLKNIGGERLDKEDDDNEEQKENEDIKPDIDLLQAASGQQAPHLPYHPQKHVNSKPPYSFSCLIFMAVEASPQKRLPVKDIYNWILTQFPYFQNAPTGWKNSVRHNLSLNKCFKKVEKDKGQSIGKGSLWCIDPAYRPNLLQALRKTPYHPYHQLQMTSTQPQNYMQYQSLPGGGRTVLPLTQRPVPNTVSPHLFPFLSRRLAQTAFEIDNEIKDVAQTLVSLKGSGKKEAQDSSSGEDIGPTWRHHKRIYRRPSSPVVVTGHPYDDHAYSSTKILDDDVPSPSSSSSIDEEYDFGDADEECESDYQSDMDWDSDDKDEIDGELPSNKKLKIDLRGGEDSPSTSGKGTMAVNESEDDEQKKIHEGASALLNLAGFLLNNRSNSNSPETKRSSASGENKKKEKKRRISKKARDEVKKVSDTQKEEEDVPRRRSVSKRKNAGSNGKYDNEEYSLMKPGKTVKSRTPSTGSSPKSGKTKAAKPKSGKDAENVSSLSSQTKSSAKSSINKTMKKSSSGRKLKLSKTFSAANKPNLPTADRSSSAINGTVPERMQKVSPRKVLHQKDSSKNAVNSKRAKANSGKIDSSSSTKLAPVSDSSQLSQEKDKVTPGEDKYNNNNNDVKNADVHGASDQLTTINERQPTIKVDHHKGEGSESGESSSRKSQSQADFAITNGEIISPAGDAPASLTGGKPPEDDKLSEDRLPAQVTATPVAAGSGGGSSSGDMKDTVANSNKTSSPSSKTSSVSSPSTAVLHKSPHFTRFSKKKAALS